MKRRTEKQAVPTIAMPIKSRCDALRLCHAPTAKATPSWAHGGATPAAPCATNRCPASRMAIE